MPTFLRERKDGQGVSECNCPDELVGKGRCIHILNGGNGNDSPLEISHISRGVYEIKVKENKLTISAQKQAIIDFFSSLPKIDEEKQQKIIDFLINE